LHAARSSWILACTALVFRKSILIGLQAGYLWRFLPKKLSISGLQISENSRIYRKDIDLVMKTSNFNQSISGVFLTLLFVHRVAMRKSINGSTQMARRITRKEEGAGNAKPVELKPCLTRHQHKRPLLPAVLAGAGNKIQATSIAEAERKPSGHPGHEAQVTFRRKNG